MKGRSIWLILAGILVLGIIIPLVLVYGAPSRQGDAGTQADAGGSGSALVGGPFTLTDQNGVRRSDSEFRGKYMLVYFGYTSCPDVCPTELSKMAAALTQLEKSAPQTAAKIEPIFITVDPARDTVSAMKAYVPHFHTRLLGLTGTEAEIDAVKRAYRVYARKAEASKDDPKNYLVDNSSMIFLMDKNGDYLEHFTSQENASAVAAALQKFVQ